MAKKRRRNEPPRQHVDRYARQAAEARRERERLEAKVKPIAAESTDSTDTEEEAAA